MEKKSPVMIIHLVLMFILLAFNAFAAAVFIGGFGPSLAGVNRLEVLMHGILNLVIIAGILFGLVYLLGGYGKKAASYYKAFLCSLLVLTALLIAVDLAFYKINALLIATVAALAVKAVSLLLLTFKKDLGAKKTWILFFVIILADAVEAVLMLLSASPSILVYRTVYAVSGLVLDGTVGLAIRGKYADKASRGSK
ncbi:MAG: hypothetical protein J6126_04640 [Clostridia bacterium]|nr:hypothetical protein [Clostridia bacterium]